MELLRKLSDKENKLWETYVAIIADKLGINIEEVTFDSSFENDLGADSLDKIELVMEFESEFNIKLSEEECVDIETVGEFFNFLCKIKFSLIKEKTLVEERENYKIGLSEYIPGSPFTKRIALFKNKDNSYICVHESDTDDFYKGLFFNTIHCVSWKPLPEDTHKPFTVPSLELLKSNVVCKEKEKSVNYLVGLTAKGVLISSLFFYFEEAFEKLELSYDKGKTWQPFGEKI